MLSEAPLELHHAGRAQAQLDSLGTVQGLSPPFNVRRVAGPEVRGAGDVGDADAAWSDCGEVRDDRPVFEDRVSERPLIRDRHGGTRDGLAASGEGLRPDALRRRRADAWLDGVIARSAEALRCDVVLGVEVFDYLGELPAARPAP